MVPLPSVHHGLLGRMPSERGEPVYRNGHLEQVGATPLSTTIKFARIRPRLASAFSAAMVIPAGHIEVGAPVCRVVNALFSATIGFGSAMLAGLALAATEPALRMTRSCNRRVVLEQAVAGSLRRWAAS
jgi:hypothetical protein